MNCSCGNLTSTVICSSTSGMNNALLADHIRDLNNGNTSTINFKDLAAMSKKTDRLDCNEDCAKIDRNRRLALALQLENPDVSAKLSAPKYSEFLKEITRKDATFATMVHEKLTELVSIYLQNPLLSFI